MNTDRTPTRFPPLPDVPPEAWEERMNDWPDRTPTTAERKAYAKGYADGAKDEAARENADKDHASLCAEIERLRAALEVISDGRHPDGHRGAVHVARAALRTPSTWLRWPKKDPSHKEDPTMPELVKRAMDGDR